jgi:hypothetical protein
MPKAYSKVRDKTGRKTGRNILSMRQSRLRGSVKSSTMEPELQRSHASCAGPQAERLSPSDDGGIKVTRTVDVAWQSTWFEEGSQNIAEDVEIGHLPQRPPPIYRQDEAFNKIQE